ALRAMPEVSYTYATIGAGATGTVTNGEVFVKLVPQAEREASQLDLMARTRQALAPVYGVRTAVLDASGPGGTQSPLIVNVRGNAVDTLQQVSAQVAAAMQAMPGVVDVATSLGDPRPEYRIEVRRDVANDAGLDIGQVAATVRPFMAGEVATRWEDPTGEERDVRVQADADARISERDLESLPVTTMRRNADGSAVTIPLGAVARVPR